MVRVAFNIRPQPIARALTDLGEQAGLQVLVRGEDLKADQQLSRPINGELSVRAALERVLANSGLTYEFLDERTVRVRTADAANEGRQAGTDSENKAERDHPFAL
ncbi:MAG TPA: STN domain-containing protein, partial [Polyangiaceae bacterium]|nr:STN domain-containing protein [Polyangiaceae bacterium]